MVISVSEQGLKPWSHQGTQTEARNKHQEKAAKELCLCFLCHTEAQPQSRLLHLGTELSQPGDLTLLSSFLCSTSSQKCHKP